MIVGATLGKLMSLQDRIEPEPTNGHARVGNIIFGRFAIAHKALINNNGPNHTARCLPPLTPELIRYVEIPQGNVQKDN